jgi:hypothetical protein
MTPPTHCKFAEFFVCCFGYRFLPDEAVQLTDLVGGVMTPPYRERKIRA